MSAHIIKVAAMVTIWLLACWLCQVVENGKVRLPRSRERTVNTLIGFATIGLEAVLLVAIPW